MAELLSVIIVLAATVLTANAFFLPDCVSDLDSWEVLERKSQSRRYRRFLWDDSDVCDWLCDPDLLPHEICNTCCQRSATSRPPADQSPQQPEPMIGATQTGSSNNNAQPVSPLQPQISQAPNSGGDRQQAYNQAMPLNIQLPIPVGQNWAQLQTGMQVPQITRIPQNQNWPQQPQSQNWPQPQPLNQNWPQFQPLNQNWPQPQPLNQNWPQPQSQNQNWPQPQPQNQNWSQLQSQNQNWPQPQPQNQNWPQPQNQNWPQPQNQNWPQLQPQNQNWPQLQPQNQNWPQPQPQNQNGPQPQPQSQNGPQPQPQNQNGPQPQPQNQNWPQPQPQPQNQNGPQPQPQSQNGPQPQPQNQNGPQPQLQNQNWPSQAELINPSNLVPVTAPLNNEPLNVQVPINLTGLFQAQVPSPLTRIFQNQPSPASPNSQIQGVPSTNIEGPIQPRPSTNSNGGLGFQNVMNGVNQPSTQPQNGQPPDVLQPQEEFSTASQQDQLPSNQSEPQPENQQNSVVQPIPIGSNGPNNPGVSSNVNASK